MQQQSDDTTVREGVVERLAEGNPKFSNDNAPAIGRKARLAAISRKHYAVSTKRARETNPRFKGYRVTTPRGGVFPIPGPSEKAASRAARQS